MFVCLWNNQTQTHKLYKLKFNNHLICLFVCGITKPNKTLSDKPNQTQPKYTKKHLFWLFVQTIDMNQAKPNQSFLTINSKLIALKKIQVLNFLSQLCLNLKYLKSVLVLRNSCTDLYLFCPYLKPAIKYMF